MKGKFLFVNKELNNFVKRYNGQMLEFFKKVDAKCQFSTFRRIEGERILCVGQEKFNKKRFKYDNNSAMFYISLFCISFPLFVNKQLFNRNEREFRCMCADSIEKSEKLENLEKVFLLKKEELKKGDMIEVKVHDGKDTVLVIYKNNKYYCLGPKCPHYSAPLKDGYLTEKYVTCPWHDAKFDLQTGECLNGPCFDDIPSFEVKVEGDNIYAYLPKEINMKKEKKVCACKDRCEKKTILIVGGGAAALGAIETFLKNGFSGKLIICSKDHYKPYDRTTISKNIANFSNTDELYESIKLKPDEYYENNNITYINDMAVTKIDSNAKKAYLSNGQIVPFDQVLIASGLSPRPSPIKLDTGVRPDNIFNIYSLKDNLQLSKLAKEGSRCVIVGSSFIGCEIASALRKKKVNVAMVTQNKVPFDNIFGEKIGNIILNVLNENNVQFFGSRKPTEYIIDKGFFKMKNTSSIHGVKLDNGEVLGCDFVIEAMGCIPNSDFVDSKFKSPNNFLITDKHFKVKDSQDMYAAGDICMFPYFYTNELLNICHWNVAIQQGRIAAHNMLNDKKVEFRFMPFFNTNIMGNNFRISGFAANYDKIIYEGDLNKKNFVGFFVKNDKVISILTLGNAKMPALNECLILNKVPKPYELEAGLKNSDSMIQSIKMNV